MSGRIFLYFMGARRISRTITLAFAIILLSLLPALALLCCPAEAHKPIIEARDVTGYDDAIYVPDPGISWAIYGYLDSADDADYYAFDIRSPLNVSAGILVPVNDVYKDFRPSFAIVGPGNNGTAAPPFAVPPGIGVRIFDMPRDSGTFYEPFGGVEYWQSPTSHVWLDRPGRYYVVVFDRSHARGDYVLVIGERESFSLADLPGVLRDVLRIRSGALDHSKKVSDSK
jgi:hypothetical protein